MDVGSEELFGNKSDAINFEPNSKTEFSKKGKTFYSEKGNNV
jgi:hypothetical protein